MRILRNILDKVAPNFHEGGKLEKLYPLYDAIDTILYVPSETSSHGPFIRDHVDVKRSMIFVVIALKINNLLFYTLFVPYLFYWIGLTILLSLEI